MKPHFWSIVVAIFIGFIWGISQLSYLDTNTPYPDSFKFTFLLPVSLVDIVYAPLSSIMDVSLLAYISYFASSAVIIYLLFLISAIVKKPRHRAR